MRTITLPDPDSIRDAPERGPLTLLLAALDLADTSLRIEHPRIDFEPLSLSSRPPHSEILAELLIARFTELDRLICLYNTAVDDALGSQPNDEILF
jgi:hypothetical protein